MQPSLQHRQRALEVESVRKVLSSSDGCSSNVSPGLQRTVVTVARSESTRDRGDVHGPQAFSSSSKSLYLLLHKHTPSITIR